MHAISNLRLEITVQATGRMEGGVIGGDEDWKSWKLREKRKQGRVREGGKD